MKLILLTLLAVLLCLPAALATAYSEPDYLAGQDLPEDVRFVLAGASFAQALTIDDGNWYVLTEEIDGRRSLHIFITKDNRRVLEAEAIGLPEINGIKPTIHAGYDSVTILYSEMLLYGFAPDGDGVWRLTYVQGKHTYKCTRYWLIEQDIWQGRFLYAENISPTLAAFNPMLYPADFDSIAKTLRTDNYALVNNPDPADRLHLRREPSRTSESMGKYYNGTPVYIEQDLGEWARVTVVGVEGYMMKRYLAEGLDMLSVEVAFAQLFIKPELAGVALNVYTAPDVESALAGVLYDHGAGREEVIVIGLAGDDWVHVICSGGLTGYMPAENFYPGNG